MLFSHFPETEFWSKFGQLLQYGSLAYLGCLLDDYSDFSYSQDQFFRPSVAFRSALEDSADSRVKWVQEINPLSVKWLDFLLITYVHPVPRLSMRETPS
jgi:hypothetical protein